MVRKTIRAAGPCQYLYQKIEKKEEGGRRKEEGGQVRERQGERGGGRWVFGVVGPRPRARQTTE